MRASAKLLERHRPRDHRAAEADSVVGWLDTHGMPDAHDEAWRYTPVDAIVAALESAATAPSTKPTIDRALVDELAGDHGGPRLVVVDGVLVPELSDGLDAIEVTWEQSLAAAAAPAQEPADGFDALSRLAGAGTSVVRLPADVDPVGPPVHVANIGLAGTAVHPRLVVHVAPGSAAHLIETYSSLDAGCTVNATTELVVGREATLTHHRVQVEAPSTVHVGRTHIDQAAGSTVRTTSILLGAAMARAAVHVRFAGPGSSLVADGLYMPKGGQRHDTVVTVDHAASHCTSAQRFRGVIDDVARGSFSGHVIVRQGTVGTDADQSNRNLLLAPTAQADTRPWLEIFADDVRCTHGATVGRLDDEALLYLRSRGIPLAEARSMLVAAFAAEVVEAMSPVSLRERVAAAVAAQVGEARS